MTAGSRRTVMLGALAGGLGLAGCAAAATVGPCWRQAFEGDGFTVCRHVAGQDELRLVWRGADGRPADSFAGLARALGPDAGRVAFAMNAGMYDPKQRPVGLFVANGAVQHPLERRAGAGNFYLKPNGVFWTDAAGVPRIDETEAFATGGAAPAWATQSGPLLVRAGALHAAIAANGTSLAVRNAVGVRGREALFVISDGKVSFGRLARFLRDGLGCADVLYLDGAVSSLWAPGLGRRDGRTGLGTFVAVLTVR